jgi:hypothetical protein
METSILRVRARRVRLVFSSCLCGKVFKPEHMLQTTDYRMKQILTKFNEVARPWLQKQTFLPQKPLLSFIGSLVILTPQNSTELQTELPRPIQLSGHELVQ